MCFRWSESPSTSFGPIAIGPACISLFRKREAISRCASSLQRSASPSHFQLCARSEIARCLHSNSISRQPTIKLVIPAPWTWVSLRPSLPSRFDPLESVVCSKHDATTHLTCRCLWREPERCQPYRPSGSWIRRLAGLPCLRDCKRTHHGVALSHWGRCKPRR